MPDKADDRSLMKQLQDQLRRILRKKSPPEPEGDPYASVTAPLRRGPKGRSGAAVADIPIAEIDEESSRTFPPRRL